MSADGSHLVPVDNDSAHSNGRGSVRVVNDVIPVLDTARFEHMQRIASVMAATSLVPESLRAVKRDKHWEPLTREQIFANCFLVVNQATRWGMDPFAVAQCCSVVHGKLTFEGKLVAAVLDAKLGVRLSYTWDGEGDRMSIVVSGTLPDGTIETVDGNVATWRTSGAGSPWAPGNYRRMLAYRGAREWARLYAPAVMLGVYSDDEMAQMASPARQPAQEAPRLRSETPPAPGPVAPTPARRRPPPAPPAPQAGPTKYAADAEPPVDAEALISHIDGELGACGDMETLDTTWSGFSGLLDRMSRTDRARAEAVYDAHEKRIKDDAFPGDTPIGARP